MAMHYSVLLNESIEGLNIKPDGIYVDATLGYAGHSSKILEKLTTGHLYGFDQDAKAIEYSFKKLDSISHDNFTIIKSNFISLKEELNSRGIEKVDGILFDLGFSSPQIDDPSRGFSFMKDAPLDMRMNQDQNKSANDVVNKYKEDELTNIFFKYAEEKYSRSIAKGIVKARPINTTMELVDVIKKNVPTSYFIKKHPEREIFQAIRIEVNKELDVLQDVLPDAIEMLNKGGRLCVITFHSLEDRIVKQQFKKDSQVNSLVSGLKEDEIPDEFKPKLKIINKKPIEASEKELKENSRSKSAKLRIVERV
ncbi:MAG: 16S rRNA (cytosine(1402)-N(4))-methyltransferase RsmH [Bacilli bacterium]|nr:16S rRNA (cytosine(1402)-N(4))-methyltransferase RsmH [Bacilli bacterium]